MGHHQYRWFSFPRKASVAATQPHLVPVRDLQPILPPLRLTAPRGPPWQSADFVPFSRAFPMPCFLPLCMGYHSIPGGRCDDALGTLALTTSRRNRQGGTAKGAGRAAHWIEDGRRRAGAGGG